MQSMQRQVVTRRTFLRHASLGLLPTLMIAAIPNVRAIANEVSFAENDGLSDAEVKSRLHQIHISYSQGDILSPSDSEFIDTYFNGARRQSGTLSGYREWGGNAYHVNGNYYLNNTWNDEYTFGGTVQGGSSTTVCSYINTYYSIMAYGLTGFSYEVIYKDTLSKSCKNVSWCTHEYHGRFFGALATQTIACWAEFSVAGGSITVDG